MTFTPLSPKCPCCGAEMWAVEEVDRDADARFDFEDVLIQRWVCQKEGRAFEGTFRAKNELPECEECGEAPSPASVEGPLRAGEFALIAGCECGEVLAEMHFFLNDVRDMGVEQA